MAFIRPDRSIITSLMKSLTRAEAQARFQPIYEIGSGAFARVEKVYDRQTSTVIAIKILNDGQDEMEQQREAVLLQSLSHPNIVRCFEFLCIDNQFHILTEFCGNDNLANHKTKITECLLLAIIRDIALALQYIHGLSLIHFDVKPQNILLSSVGEAKLADFGVTRHAESTIARSQCAKPGTVLYMAPELLAGETATSAVDIWALGITAFEMAVGVPLGLTDSATFDQWLASHDPIFGATQQRWSPFFTRMVRRMLSERPESRLSAGQILALPAIAELPPTWLLCGNMIEPNSEIFWEDP
jgi:serine/threonine protein kinase